MISRGCRLEGSTDGTCSPRTFLASAWPATPPASEVTWPLQRLHAVLSELEGPNDGLVSVTSAQAFGTPLPSWPADHLRQMNWMTPPEPSVCPPVPDLYAQILDNLAALGFAAAEQCVACSQPPELGLGKNGMSWRAKPGNWRV